MASASGDVGTLAPSGISIAPPTSLMFATMSRTSSTLRTKPRRAPVMFSSTEIGVTAGLPSWTAMSETTGIGARSASMSGL